MATKSGQQEPEKAEVVEELLDALETSLDRVKVLYEQYFLGIQKQPPTFMHTDIERKIRDLAQLQIRNTALRYRYATLSQKFGSYNSYWRRTLRQIEQGTYTRNLSKIGRQAARSGADVPEEILAAMPKRMREQVRRDREAALANAQRRGKPVSDGSELLTLSDEDVEIDVDDFEPAAFIGESSAVRRNVLTAGGAHRITEDDEEFDVDAFFAKVTSEGDPNPLPVGLPTPAAVPVARKRTGSSGHPRPAALSGSATAAIPRGDRLPSADAPLEGPVGKRPSAPPPSAGARPALPSIVAAKVAAAKAVAAPAPAAAGDEDDDAVQTSVIPVRPTPPPVPLARATQALPRLPIQAHGQGPSASAAEPSKPPVPAAEPSKPPMSATQSIKPPVPAVAPSKPPVSATQSIKPPVPATQSSKPPVPVTQPIKPPMTATQSIKTPIKPPVFSTQSIKPPALAPSQATRPLPVAPGAAAARATAQVETMSGPFPRIPSLPSVPAPPRPAGGSPAPTAAPTPGPAPRPAERVAPAEPPTPAPAAEQAVAPERTTPERAAAPERPTPVPKSPRPPSERPTPEPRQAPPPGMSDADVNALYAKYVKAKEILGEQAGPGAYGKLLKTINAQAPKIMEQYKSKGVDFSVVVKDNQVIIRAKPKS